ncbi:hypothetical protein G9A89_006822 [Geosiphon pyriformis]|nr:hypothetical protein G9A89_006822 [Geosiphon pyriformis]
MSSSYTKRKPVERVGEEDYSQAQYPPSRRIQHDLSFLNGPAPQLNQSIPKAPNKLPLRTSSDGESIIPGVSTQRTIVQPVKSTMTIAPTGSSAQTTIVQPVKSTMTIGPPTPRLIPNVRPPKSEKSSSVDTLSISSLDREFQKNEEELSKISSKRRTGDQPTSPTSPTPTSPSTPNYGNISPPLSPLFKKLPSLSMASDILASSEAMLSTTVISNGYSLLDTTNEMLIQLLISQAMIDSQDYEILSLEDVEELKKEHALLTNRMGALTSKLALESKIREAANSLARLHVSNKRVSRQATDHLSQANRKVDQLATELWKLDQRANDIQRRLLSHMSAVLTLGIRKLEEKQTQPPIQVPLILDNGYSGIDNLYNEIMGVDKSANAELVNKVANLETSLQNVHHTLAEARVSIKRKEKEIEELKLKVDDGAAEARERTIAELRTELEEVGSRLDIVLRKHKAAKKDIFSDDNEEDLSDDSDSINSYNRLSTMTTATQHLQKEQYRNISKNLTDLEKSLQEYQFRIYKLDQDLIAARNNAEEDAQTLQSNLNHIIQEKENAIREAENERNNYEFLERKVIDLEHQVRNGQNLEEKVRVLEHRQSLDKGMGQKRNADLESKLSNVTKEYELAINSLKELFTNMPKKIDDNLENKTFTLDTFISHVRGIGDENAVLLDTVSRLQTRLDCVQKEMKDSEEQGKLKKLLKTTQSELEEAKAKLNNLELKAQNANAVLSSSSDKEAELRDEITQLREELEAIKRKVRKYEATLKRQSVIEFVEGGNSIKDEFQQQLATQEQEYEAQLKEKDGLISNLRSVLETITTERDNAKITLQELEEMLRSKSRTLDQREVTISKLEGDIVNFKVELAELKTASDVREKKTPSIRSSSSNSTPNSSEVTAIKAQFDNAHEELSALRKEKQELEAELQQLKEAFRNAQLQFSTREEALENRTDVIQNELDGILREFDRLTRNFLDFDSERHKLQANMDKLSKHCEQLENELSDERIKNLGSENKEPVTTATLRKEFRHMMADLRADHAKAMQREMEEKKKLENLARNLRREKEAEKFEKANKGTQTALVISV